MNKLQTILNDALGRRTAIARSGTMMSESRSDAYGYNTRSELISAAKNGVDEYAYQYDDIGNRESSVEPDNAFSYTSNELNQYDAITSQTSLSSVALAEEDQTFAPHYDLDGNQTLVKTKTGIWSVTYNGENRPILWTCGATNIVMKFDRMGRRVEYIEREGETTLKHQKFVYDGYRCIQRLNGSSNAVTDLFEWDPTEPVATRPLYWQHRTSSDNYSLFYTHDGNKNVSEVVFYQRARGVAAHYEYAPFGEVMSATGHLGFLNPFRFSSEYHDEVLGLVYYNYRHYNPRYARWLSRDRIEERGGLSLLGTMRNDLIARYDRNGDSLLLAFTVSAIAIIVNHYLCDWYAEKDLDGTDAYKHCMVSCRYRGCNAILYGELGSTIITIVGGMVHELISQGNTIEGAIDDIKSNLIGVVASFSDKTCEEGCECEKGKWNR